MQLACVKLFIIKKVTIGAFKLLQETSDDFNTPYEKYFINVCFNFKIDWIYLSMGFSFE